VLVLRDDDGIRARGLVRADHLLPNLDLLGIPRFAAGATLGVLLASAATLHVAAVVTACSVEPERRAAPHPLVAGLASAVVPSWGQILVGHRARAALFLAALWLLAVAWLAATPAGLGSLQELGFDVPRGARDSWGPVALVTAPILLWALAIYDAAVGAVMLRREV
jgi:hypothetical protein